MWKDVSRPCGGRWERSPGPRFWRSGKRNWPRSACWESSQRILTAITTSIGWGRHSRRWWNGRSVIEIMCHPGIPDGDLAGQSRYLGDRQAEFTVLANPSLREALEPRFRLVGYASLHEGGRLRNPSTPARRAAS